MDGVAEEAQAQAQPQAQFSPITSQEQLNAVIHDRIERAKASARSEYADYEELKSKAAELDSLRESQKSELEKANDRAKAAEAERDALKAERQRAEWAEEASRESGVPAGLLRGSTKKEIAEHAKAIAEAMKPKPPMVPSDGARPETPESGDWIRDMFNRR